MCRADIQGREERRKFTLWYVQLHLFASLPPHPPAPTNLLSLKPHLFLVSHFPGPLLSSASFLVKSINSNIPINLLILKYEWLLPFFEWAL